MQLLPIIRSPVGALRDAQDRKISYLRVSVTDRCNYTCTYCVPAGGVPMVRRNRLLNFEEICHLVRLMATLGVQRVRLTGGEPTIRKGIVGLVGKLREIDGIAEVVMTSNAHLLDTMAGPLANAGLAGVNVSLDTLSPEGFAKLTGRGDLARVIRGIDACLAEGMSVSTNAVALRGINDREIVKLCEFAWNRGILPRFIEPMPMSGGDAYDPSSALCSAEIRQILEAYYGEEPVPIQMEGSNKGPARYWSLGDETVAERRFGIISAMSEHFCSTCNRLRLSAIGHLHTCLAHDNTLDLKKLLRTGCSDQIIERSIVDALAGKKSGHEFQESGSGGPAKHMISIGG